MMMFICIEAQLIRKLSNTEAELKKSVAYKKKACMTININWVNEKPKSS